MAATKSLNKAKKPKNEKDLDGPAKLGGKDYERELAKLHGELVKLQLWVVAKGLKVVIVFEGRDGAGKGGIIKAITERVSPRVYRVVALPAPTEREQSQMYVQRFNATCGICRRRAKSRSSTAAGITAPGSSGSWNSARWSK
jgi:polyphosphate kinase 2 (PPK2 family)